MEELFDDFVRDYDGRAHHQEGRFQYMNRSARAECVLAREILQDWFDRYPTHHKTEMRHRFRISFDDAFFELFIHELLLKLGGNITIHPPMGSEVNTSPDFHVLFNDGTEVYVEACVFTNETDEERGQNAVLNNLYDMINDKLNSPDHFIAIRRFENPSKIQPSSRKLVRFIEENLEKHTWVTPDDHNYEIPVWEFQDRDFILHISPIRKRDSRGAPGVRNIGLFPTEVTWMGNEVLALAKDIKKKKPSRYGIRSHQYIIAINMVSRWLWSVESEVKNAFYGPHGIWFGSKGPVNSRISGVLLTRAFPYHLSTAAACLYLNPHPATKCENPLLSLPKAVLQDESPCYNDGESLQRIFRIGE